MQTKECIMMTKREQYEQLLPQVCALIEGEHDEVAVMSNVVAALHEAMGFFWTGFYRVVNNELLVGPFQGPTACFHIAYGRGVCGTAWKTGRTQVVPDVELFPGHIACSSLSRSEIVVPLLTAMAVCVLYSTLTPRNSARSTQRTRSIWKAFAGSWHNRCTYKKH